MPLAALGGCGFQPVYGSGGSTSEVGTAAGLTQNQPRLVDELAAVRVNAIGERNGQVMRRTLQRQMEGLRPGTQGRYELDVSLNFTAEVLGYRTDGLVTRVRYVGAANWILFTSAIPREIVERGSARTIDAYNLPDLQFFASDASRDDMERRLIAELSERVTVGVAVALRRRLAAAATPAA